MDWTIIQDILKSGWGAITSAPIPVLGLMLLAAGLAWWARGWIHHGRVDALEERLKLANEQQTASAAAAAQSTAAPIETTLALAARDPETAKQLADLKRANVSVILREQEDRIRDDLVKLKLNQPTAETVDLLVQHLALTQLFLAGERVYRLIFGSQIAALKHLNSSGPTSQVDIKKFYDEAKIKFPTVYDKYGFDAYLNFLTSFHLVTTNDAGNYAITQLGREFLQWMVVQGLSELKPF